MRFPTAIRWVLPLALSLAAPASALAQQPPPAHPAPVMPSEVPAKVEIRVQVIRATKGGAGVDPKLSSLAATLAKLPFDSFTLVQEESYRIADGAAVELPISSKRVVRLRLGSHNSTEARVEVTYTHEDAEPVDMQVSIKRNRAFLSVLKGGDNGALLLKIDVGY